MLVLLPAFVRDFVELLPNVANQTLFDQFAKVGRTDHLPRSTRDDGHVLRVIACRNEQDLAGTRFDDPTKKINLFWGEHGPNLLAGLDSCLAGRRRLRYRGVVAGWDLGFDVALSDRQLARDCFRILRSTCARHYLQLNYYEERRSDRRVHYMLVFNGRPPQLGLAAADFALEMHAVSMLQRQARLRQLPLRLLQWVTYSGSEEPFRLQPPSDRVPEGKREGVVRHLEEYALAWGAWRRGELSPADYLEAQHSLLTNLALDLAEGATREMSYPNLIRALRVPEHWERDCLDLGTARNRVKHRGLRHEAERYVEMYEQCVYSVAFDVTGIDAMPRSAYMLRWEQAGERVPPDFLTARRY